MYSRYHATRQSIQTLPLATETTDNESTLRKKSRYSLPRFRQEPPIALCTTMAVILRDSAVGRPWWPPKKPETEPSVFFKVRHIEIGGGR